MRKYPVPGVALAVILAFSTACDSDSIGPEGTALSPEEAEFLATETDELLNSMLLAQLTALGDEDASTGNGLLKAAFEPIVTTFEFERVRPCRNGGNVVFNGSGTHSRDRETQTSITDFAGEKTINDCIRVRGDLSFTVSGGGTFEGHRMKVAGQWSGLQTNDQMGTLVYTVSDGRTKECTYELHRVFDPATGTVTLTGHVCDKEIDKSWQRDG